MPDAHLDLTGVIHKLKTRELQLRVRKEAHVHIALRPKPARTQRAVHIGASQTGHFPKMLYNDCKDLILGITGSGALMLIHWFHSGILKSSLFHLVFILSIL
jgi:hypothetical protein